MPSEVNRQGERFGNEHEGYSESALFVLAHDAAHYRLYETRWLNDAVGRLCGTIAGVSMCTYRVIHPLHHNHLYGPQDPDIALHGGYPRGKAYLAKKLAKREANTNRKVRSPLKAFENLNSRTEAS